MVGAAWGPRPRLTTDAPSKSLVHAGLFGLLTLAKVFFGNLAVVAGFMFSAIRLLEQIRGRIRNLRFSLPTGKAYLY